MSRSLSASTTSRCLHRRLWRQPAVVLSERHGAAGQRGPHAKAPDGADFDVDRVLHPGREEVVVVGGGGAAGEKQFGEGHGGREVKIPRGQPGPDRVEVLQPGEQRCVGHRTPGAGECLVEVVMRVDQAGQHHVVAGLEGLSTGCGRRLAGAEHLHDFAAADHQAARGVEAVGGEGRQRVPDPEPGRGRRLGERR
ncbi:hypothetical protein ABIE00_000564 [Arthrobacter sp. OAP107]